MNNTERQILKNQSSIMMAIVGLLDHHKVEDLDYAININNRMKETRDVLLGANE